MKKHILKVWMMIAIGFLAVDVVGQAPTVVSFSPNNGATGVAVDAHISVVFDMDIRARSFPSNREDAFIRVHYENGDVYQEYWSFNNNFWERTLTGYEEGEEEPIPVYSYNLLSPDIISIVNNTLQINVTGDSSPNYLNGLTYYVTIGAYAIYSVDYSTRFSGFVNNSTWRFSIENQPLPPTPDVYTPSQDATSAPTNQPLSLQFDIDIQAGSGSLEIWEDGGFAAWASYDQTDFGTDLTIVGNNTLSIALPLNFDEGTSYYVLIDPGFVASTESVDFDGFVASSDWDFTTEFLPLNPPTLSPIDGAPLAPGAPGVPRNSILEVTFDMDIELSGAGSIGIWANGSREKLLDGISSNVSIFNNNTLRIDLSADPLAEYATLYDVRISSDFIKRVGSEVYFDGFAAGEWSFTTEAQPLELTLKSPVDGETGVPLGQSLVATFNQDIQFAAGGASVSIHRYSDDGLFETLTDVAGLSITGMALTINPTTDFAEGIRYYVTIPEGDIETITGTPFSGISVKDDWDFITDAPPPVIAAGGYSPAAGTLEVSRNPVLELTFAENIVKGNSGYFKIFSSAGGLEIVGIPRTNDQVTVLENDNKLTVSLSNITLEYGTEYYIIIDEGFVKSATTGVDFGGIAISSEWYFTTESSPPFWASGYPIISGQNSLKFDFEALADVTGNVYGVVTGTATQPSEAQIVAGDNSSSSPARIAFNEVVESTVSPAIVEVLFNDDTPTGTNYYLHTVFVNGGKYSTVETITIDRIIPEINELTSLPLDGHITVSIDESVTIVFMEPVFGFDGSGTLPLDNTYFSFQYDDNGTPIDVAYAFSQTTTSEQSTVVLQPNAVLLEDKEYTITIAPVSDASGNLTSPIVRTFETDKQNMWIGGGVVTAWADPLNWSSGTYASGKSVTIPVASTAFPVITTSTIDVHNLTIQSGAVVTHTGGTLNVTGLLTLKSSVDVNASYIYNGEAGAVLNVTGSNVRVEQVIDNINMTYLISSPTEGSSAANFGSYYPLYTYNNTSDAWDAVSSGVSMAPGIGYRMWTNDSMVAFSGDFNAGAYMINLTRTDGGGFGWNLVGNPYPASIDWTALGIIESSTIEDNFWIWMPTLRSYGAYSASTEIPLNIDSSIIPSNHAFLVKVKLGSSAGSIEFKPEAQVANNENYLKSGSTKPVVDFIKLAGVAPNNVKDEMAVAFIDQASTGLDRFDMEKRFSNRDHLFELFSLAGTMRTAINSIPLNGSYEVPLGFSTRKTGDYAIEMIVNNAEDVESVLVDNLDGTEIRLLPGERYDFTVDAIGLNTTRFKLKFFKVSTDFAAESSVLKQTSVFVHNKEVFVNSPTDFVGAKYQVYDFAGRFIKTGVIATEGVNSLGHLVEGSYIINVNTKSSATLENHKVVVY